MRGVGGEDVGDGGLGAEGVVGEGEVLGGVLGDEGLERGLVVGEGFDLGGGGLVDVLHCLETSALGYTESVDAFRVLGYQGGHL